MSSIAPQALDAQASMREKLKRWKEQKAAAKVSATTTASGVALGSMRQPSTTSAKSVFLAPSRPQQDARSVFLSSESHRARATRAPSDNGLRKATNMKQNDENEMPATSSWSMPQPSRRKPSEERITSGRSSSAHSTTQSARHDTRVLADQSQRNNIAQGLELAASHRAPLKKPSLPQKQPLSQPTLKAAGVLGHEPVQPSSRAHGVHGSHTASHTRRKMGSPKGRSPVAAGRRNSTDSGSPKSTISSPRLHLDARESTAQIMHQLEPSPIRDRSVPVRALKAEDENSAPNWGRLGDIMREQASTIEAQQLHITEMERKLQEQTAKICSLSEEHDHRFRSLRALLLGDRQADSSDQEINNSLIDDKGRWAALVVDLESLVRSQKSLNAANAAAEEAAASSQKMCSALQEQLCSQIESSVSRRDYQALLADHTELTKDAEEQSAVILALAKEVEDLTADKEEQESLRHHRTMTERDETQRASETLEMHDMTIQILRDRQAHLEQLLQEASDQDDKWKSKLSEVEEKHQQQTAQLTDALQSTLEENDELHASYIQLQERLQQQNRSMDNATQEQCCQTDTHFVRLREQESMNTILASIKFANALMYDQMLENQRIYQASHEESLKQLQLLKETCDGKDNETKRYKTMLETHVGELSSRMKRGLEQCLAKLRQTEEQLENERRRRSALEEQIRSEPMLAPSSGSSV